MRYKRKLIWIGVLAVVLSVIQYVLPAHSRVVTLYDALVFRPFQSVRNIIFSISPVSIGDLLYIVGGVVLTVLVVKWLYYVIRFRKHRHELSASLLHTVIGVGIIYILFLLGWGGNYYKPSLTDYWNLDRSEWKKDTTLPVFDAYLITKLNEHAPDYRAIPFSEMDNRARSLFKAHTEGKTKTYGVKVKPSIFGYLMQHMGIQGYYNPWTGEAQVNQYLPSFMLPFVICHEMAHQAGIAAEDDANLLSYVVGTTVTDPTFRYSAYFNLWLYTHARLRRSDSTLANKLAANLNPLTKSHLDTLRDIRRRYKSEVSEYSGAFYDGYLKLHHQKDGIESYNKVAITAWAWEQRENKEQVIELP